MKNITIKSLKAENFKSFTDKEIVLNPQRTIIYGRNGIGKTTISDIVKWTLFGLADTSARPVDSNNEYFTINPIHTTVVFDVDGKEICIEKIQKMEFTRNGEFKGNKNSYLVNGIPKTAKALKEYVKGNILSMEDFLFFTDIDQFLKKSMDERREIVSKYATSVNDEDVIATDTRRFSGISKMFKDGNLKELTLRCSRTIKELEKERDSIPARIDEISRLKNSLVEQISNLDVGQADNEKKFDDSNLVCPYCKRVIENSRNLEVSRKKYLDERQKAARNSEIDDRIAELKDRQKKIAQDIANEFKTKSLLEEFKMAKAELISASVNRSFTFVRFKLFETQVNGELKDTCRMLVNGVDMESGLNDSDSLLAGLDILTTFQRLNNVLVPVFLDRAESINESRIPDTDNQLILLKVSDDKELIVK